MNGISGGWMVRSRGVKDSACFSFQFSCRIDESADAGPGVEVGMMWTAVGSTFVSLKKVCMIDKGIGISTGIFAVCNKVAHYKNELSFSSFVGSPRCHQFWGQQPRTIKG